MYKKLGFLDNIFINQLNYYYFIIYFLRSSKISRFVLDLAAKATAPNFANILKSK